MLLVTVVIMAATNLFVPVMFATMMFAAPVMIAVATMIIARVVRPGLTVAVTATLVAIGVGHHGRSGGGQAQGQGRNQQQGAVHGNLRWGTRDQARARHLNGFRIR